MNRLLPIVSMLVAASLSEAQPLSVISVDVDGTGYTREEGDRTRFATELGPTVAANAPNFDEAVSIWDIVAINGKPAKGVMVVRGITLNLRPAPTPGQAIADVTRGNFSHSYLELLQEDGTAIGTLTTDGFFQGPPPPGSPRLAMASNNTITGGTGMFLGARGQLVQTPRVPAAPIVRVQSGAASIREDPSQRRALGAASRFRMLITLLPFATPEIIGTPNGPAIVHAGDGQLVTAANPARPGEVLTLYATGLGPTKTALNPGEPFPANPLAIVNSPVEILVGGAPATVLYAGGVPTTTDRYQVNFRLPNSVPAGSPAIQLSVGFILGTPVALPVQ